MSIGSVSSSAIPYSTSSTPRPQNQDLMNLDKAPQIGDVSGTQGAFSKPSTDSRSIHLVHGAHHRHTGSAPAPTATITSSDSNSTVTSETDAATSSDPIASLVNFLSKSIGAMLNQHA